MIKESNIIKKGNNIMIKLWKKDEEFTIKPVKWLLNKNKMNNNRSLKLSNNNSNQIPHLEQGKWKVFQKVEIEKLSLDQNILNQMILKS